VNSPEQSELDLFQLGDRDEGVHLASYVAEYREHAKLHALDSAAIGDPDAFQDFTNAIRRVAQRQELLTADDVRLELGSANAIVTNAMGAAFSKAARNNWIQAYGFTTSKAESRNGSIIRVWRSRLR
jgi:hypothetical protein